MWKKREVRERLGILRVCMSVCSFMLWSWQEEEGGKGSKSRSFLVPVGSCSESLNSSTVNWGWGGGCWGINLV